MRRRTGQTRFCRNPRCAEAIREWDRAGRLGLCPSCRLMGAAGPVVMLIVAAAWKWFTG